MTAPSLSQLLLPLSQNQSLSLESYHIVLFCLLIQTQPDLFPGMWNLLESPKLSQVFWGYWPQGLAQSQARSAKRVVTVSKPLQYFHATAAPLLPPVTFVVPLKEIQMSEASISLYVAPHHPFKSTNDSSAEFDSYADTFAKLKLHYQGHPIFNCRY